MPTAKQPALHAGECTEIDCDTCGRRQEEMTVEDQYLGDGVYASFDGWQLWLDLRGQDRGTRIALEPAVFNALKQYAKECWETRRPDAD